MNLNKYDGIIFDCDGVILDSNKIKSDAFFKTALPYGKKAANELLQYHQAHGGISRFQKFNFFLNNIVFKKSDGPTYEELLDNYGKTVLAALLECEIIEKLLDLRELTVNVPWFVVSGSDQKELNSVFHKRNLEKLFDGGIFGSPRSKYEILNFMKTNGTLSKNMVFIGDSKLDYEVASFFGLDFIFVSNWTEFSGWQAFFANKPVEQLGSVCDLLKINSE